MQEEEVWKESLAVPISVTASPTPFSCLPVTLLETGLWEAPHFTGGALATQRDDQCPPPSPRVRVPRAGLGLVPLGWRSALNKPQCWCEKWQCWGSHGGDMAGQEAREGPGSQGRG